MSFGFLNVAPMRMMTYPTRPMTGVGIPKVFETSPVIIASQLTLLLILHGWKAGCAARSHSKYTAKIIPSTASA